MDPGQVSGQEGIRQGRNGNGVEKIGIHTRGMGYLRQFPCVNKTGRIVQLASFLVPVLLFGCLAHLEMRSACVVPRTPNNAFVLQTNAASRLFELLPWMSSPI